MIRTVIDTIIFDWKRTLYDPETKMLIQGAGKVLDALSKQNVKMVLIGKGTDDMDKVLDKLKARKYFSTVHFVSAKSDELFEKYISKDHPSSTLVIGNRGQGEIAIGKSLGAKAVWLRAGEFKDELPLSDTLAPDWTIGDIEDLLSLTYN